MKESTAADEVQQEIVNRLKTTEGHLQAVTRMAITGAPCEEILHQLDAVEAALRATRVRLFSYRLQQSIDVVVNSPDAEQRTAELERLLALWEPRARRLLREERRTPALP